MLPPFKGRGSYTKLATDSFRMLHGGVLMKGRYSYLGTYELAFMHNCVITNTVFVDVLRPKT